MTFDEAMNDAKANGSRVTHKGLGTGWSIFYHKGANGFFCLNPHTGSNYQYTPTEDDKKRTWTRKN